MADVTIELNQKWRRGARISEGGFGQVFAAEAEDGSPAVVKLVPKMPGAARELLFQSVAGRNIIPILDTGEWQGYYALVMPRAERSLRDHLASAGGKLPTDEAIAILIDVAESLASLQGIVHRDLKPENVMLYQGHWCLADFGIARYAEATTAPDTHKYSLTPPYAAPEQWRSERATPAADVYAFGVMAFELLEGHRPFPGPDAPAYREQHLSRPAPSLTGAPTAIASLVAECLYKAPEARPTPANILERLRRAHQPPSPAAAKLQAVNQMIVGKRSEEAARALAQQLVQERRAELFNVAQQSLQAILRMLASRIADAAPASDVSWKPSLAIRLGDGGVGADIARQAPADCLAHGPDLPPFDVIAYSAIGARKPPDRYGYEGRAHSLWYCDAWEEGQYRWFETAFMICALTGQISNLDPFALPPTDPAAARAFAQGLSDRQVAWEPLPFDQGDEEQFIERWLGWFAAAVDGSLSRPSPMPEHSGGRHRRASRR